MYLDVDTQLSRTTTTLLRTYHYKQAVKERRHANDTDAASHTSVRRTVQPASISRDCRRPTTARLVKNTDRQGRRADTHTT